MPAAPYGTWKSPITSDLIVAQSIGLSEVRLDGDAVYWLESRPREGGRSVVVRAGEGDVTPLPFNVRTRIHEYGGGAWTVAGGALWFSNDADRRLYRGREPVTPEGPWRYGDGVVDALRQRWIGVREDHSGPGEPVNAIVSVPDGRVLADGHDFFSSPRLSPDGRRLAYLAWDHPRMPWVGTTLFVRDLEGGEAAAVAGGPHESVFQPEWAPDGSALFFISDRSGWWNLYRLDLGGGEARPLAPMAAEFGQPQWVLGMSTYAPLSPDRLVCSYTANGLETLAVLEVGSGKLTPVATPYTEFSSVRAEGDTVVFRGGAPSLAPAIVKLNWRTGVAEVLARATGVADEFGGYFTTVEHIEFPTEAGGTAFALHYPAFNPDYAAAGELPPLLVKCHGGPTAAASSTLDLRTQYWTSRGISVVDVNYGGSTGYGREYRRRLDGQWGVVDVDDCVNAARFLAAQGQADPARCVITGGSAGGYTTLAALAFRDWFRGGASHYGVSDPAALARDTHKFESRYLDGLIGSYPEHEDLYRARAPLLPAGKITAPVIFFQDDEDRVVPPSQTDEMVAALRQKGTPVGYLLFAGEQHGFRRADNIRRALDAELYFYAVNVFGVELRF